MRVIQDFIVNLENVLAQSSAELLGERALKTPGAFVAYDFHLTAQGPRLIEINTNAGGAFLCLEQLSADKKKEATQKFVEMLRSEWSFARPGAPLHTIAIVDETPTEQFLYPEFLLIQKALEMAGHTVHICAPGDLVYRDSALFLKDECIDLLYNRLTDFYLRESAHSHLKEATQTGHTLVTPAPEHHALFAHKGNLTQLSDPAILKKWGVANDEIDLLVNVIPPTTYVTAENAHTLWHERKRYFFKPVEGFGSRGAYRGDKLTRGVWTDILAGNYVAQEYVAPPTILTGEEILKFDLRVFTYRAEPLLLAARLYQGQTTNFRTPGGGFAEVVIDDSEL